ncbi:MAG: cysteine hydrolase family protein [Beijerinckiaceae bacterium]
MAAKDKFQDHCWKDVVPATDMRIYEPYTRPTKVGQKPALLAIDLYNLVYRGGPYPPIDLVDRYPSSCGIYAHQAIEPTQRLFAAARRAGLPVIFCTQDIRAHSRPLGAVSTKRRSPPPQTDDYDIHPAFPVEQSDIVIRKQRASVFQGTPIVSHLKLLGVETLIVCGEATSGCVRASVVDGYSSGFNMNVVEECTFDQTELTHKVNMFDMAHKYADVMRLAEVEEHLLSLA